MKFVKNFITTILVLVISAGVFFYIVKDQKVKDNILKTTLELFGDDLLAMYPEGQQKEMIAHKFQEFLNKAEQNEVPPQEIERVAAGILNITTLDSLVPAETVIDFIASAEQDSVMIVDTVGTGKPEKSWVDWPENRFRRINDKKYKHKWDKESKEELAQRLKEIKNLQFEMKTQWEQDSTFYPLQKHVIFHADSGLRVEIGLQVKELFKNNEELENQLKELEKEKIIVWNEDLHPSVDGIKAARMVMKNLQIPDSEIRAMIMLEGLPDSIDVFENFNITLDSLGNYFDETVKEIERLDAEKEKNNAH